MRRLTFFFAQASQNSESPPAEKVGAIDTNATSILESIDNIWDGILLSLRQISVGAIALCFAFSDFGPTNLTAATLQQNSEAKEDLETCEIDPTKNSPSEKLSGSKDLLPAGFRVLEFPEKSVGELYLCDSYGNPPRYKIRVDKFSHYNTESLGEMNYGLARGRIVMPSDANLMIKMAKDAKLDFLADLPTDTFRVIELSAYKGGYTDLDMRQLCRMKVQDINFWVDMDQMVDLTELPPLPELVSARNVRSVAGIHQWLNRAPKLHYLDGGHAEQYGNNINVSEVNWLLFSEDRFAKILPILNTMPNLTSVQFTNRGRRFDLDVLKDLQRLASRTEFALNFGGTGPRNISLDQKLFNALVQLDSLETLRISTIEPAIYPQLHRLKLKRFEWSRIETKAQANGFAGIKTLEYFPDFSIKELGVLAPLADRTNVKRLVINKHRLQKTVEDSDHHLSAAIDANCKSLRTLRLSQVLIDKETRDAISKCVNLVSLELDRVVFIGCDGLTGDFPKLTRLSIKNFDNQQRRLGYENEALRLHLSIRANKLKLLSLKGRWYWRDLKFLDGCTELEQLSLRVPGPFDDRFAKVLAKMPKLWNFDHGWGRVCDRLLLSPVGIEDLAKCHHLHKVSVFGDLDFDSLAKLENNAMLFKFEVFSSRLDEAERKRLWKLLTTKQVYAKRKWRSYLNSYWHSPAAAVYVPDDGIARTLSISGVRLDDEVVNTADKRIQDTIEARTRLRGSSAKESLAKWIDTSDWTTGRVRLLITERGPQLLANRLQERKELHASNGRELRVELLASDLEFCPTDIVTHPDLDIEMLSLDTIKSLPTELVGNTILLDREGKIRFISPHAYHVDRALKALLDEKTD
jgi:hypothetical protein